MKAPHYFLLQVCLGLILLITGCKKNAQDNQTLYGPDVALGNGKVNSFFSVSGNQPQELGVELIPGTLDNLPTTMNDYQVAFDSKALALTPYDHITMGWAPAGHPPPGIFTFPHFDVHFYMLTDAEQMQIPALTATNQDLFAAPPAGYLPDDFTVPFAIVPMMGKHWADRTSTTMAGTTPFTHEFLYGTYNHKMAFVEPMITRALLLAGTEVHQAIKQPTLFEKTGKWYPTRYNIYTMAGGHLRISFDQFVQR